MDIFLPSTQIFCQRSRHEDGWSDHYGALHEAADYAGLALPEQYMLRGIWQHGCLGPWEATSPGPLFFNSPQANSWPLFVSRPEEADYLRAHGYPRAQAIGTPIIYTSGESVARMPGTLLVMPTHTLAGDSFEDRTPFGQYADEIKSITGRFRRVVVCVHPNCRKNDLWIREFSERGIEIILGAQTNDRNALRRMRGLFEQFESVTTNGWGSHVAYALYFGAKVSLYGREVVPGVANSLRDVSWAADPATLMAQLSEAVNQRKREFLHRLYRTPDEGVKDINWGRWFLGAERKLTPANMKMVLAEIIPHLLEFQEVQRTRDQRRVIRQEAARLVAAKRGSEATRLLLAFVQQAAATKQALFILETLHEISADLQPLDPVRAAQLHEQARLLTGRIEATRRPAA